MLLLKQAATPHSPLKQLPFGLRGLNAPCIEALDRRGLPQELEWHKRLQNPHANAVQRPRRQAGPFASIPFHDGDIDPAQWLYGLPGSTATSLITKLQELETVLARRAEALGVTIRRGLAITDVQQTAEEVTVRAANQSFTSKWLVGCARPDILNLSARSWNLPATPPRLTWPTRSSSSPAATCPPPAGTRSRSPATCSSRTLTGAFHATGQPATREHVQEAALRRISNTNLTLSALPVASTWTDQARPATTYRAGRLLLAGNATHIHSPPGGQGRNLGLGDALNLGWKLAATLHGQAPAGLLDSYPTERHPIGAQVLEWSRAQVALLSPSSGSRALHAIVRDLLTTRDGATYVAGRVWGISTHHALGGNHPLAGYSAPRAVSWLVYSRGGACSRPSPAPLSRFRPPEGQRS